MTKHGVSDEARSWLVAGVLLLVVGATAFFVGGTPEELVTLEVTLASGSGALDDEALASEVTYSEPFVVSSPRTLVVAASSVEPPGALLVSLVDEETGLVREAQLDTGARARFARVDSGRYVVRGVGSGRGRARLQVSSGGVPFELTALAALLVVAPAALGSLRRRRRRP